MTLKQKLLNYVNEIAVRNGYTDARTVVEKYAYESKIDRLYKKSLKQ